MACKLRKLGGRGCCLVRLMSPVLHLGPAAEDTDPPPHPGAANPSGETRTLKDTPGELLGPPLGPPLKALRMEDPAPPPPGSLPCLPLSFPPPLPPPHPPGLLLSPPSLPSHKALPVPLELAS